MTLAIAHSASSKAILDAVREVRPPFSPEGVVQEFADLLKRYSITKVRGDRYAAEWCQEQFRKRGIGYEPADRSKSELYRDLLPVINSGQCELLDHERLVTQLVGLERKTARGGRDSIDHPPGTHDDVANAVAGALVYASKPRQGLLSGVISGYGGCGAVTRVEPKPQLPFSPPEHWRQDSRLMAAAAPRHPIKGIY